MTSLYQRLRTETGQDHDAVEAAFDLAANLASPERYRDLLGRLHGLHAAFDEAAAPHLTDTGLLRTGRLALLEGDLRALGAHASAIPGAYRGAFSAILVDRARAVGAAYVVEGSSLGGLVIAREVGRRLGLGPESGVAFFAGDGRETATSWRRFCAALDALAPALDGERVVAAARETFALVGTVLAARPDRRAA